MSLQTGIKEATAEVNKRPATQKVSKKRPAAAEVPVPRKPLVDEEEVQGEDVEEETAGFEEDVELPSSVAVEPPGPAVAEDADIAPTYEASSLRMSGGSTQQYLQVKVQNKWSLMVACSKKQAENHNKDMHDVIKKVQAALIQKGSFTNFFCVQLRDQILQS
jgi:hypothetical protein